MWHIIAKAVIYTAVPIIIREVVIYLKKDDEKDEPKPPIKRKTDDRHK